MAVLICYFLLLSTVLCAGIANADYECTFDEDNCQWMDYVSAGVSWRWSGQFKADTSHLTDFSPPETTNYMFVQNTNSTGERSDGAIIVSLGQDVNKNDLISLDIYQHLVAASTDRIRVFFKSNVDYTYFEFDIAEVEGWNTNTFQCGVNVNCCLTYPCRNYFAVRASISTPDDFVAFDNVIINAA